MSDPPIPYYGLWESGDGLSSAEIQVEPPSTPYPAFVRIEVEFGGSILASDARDLAAHIGAAASQADWLTRKARLEERT